MLRRLPIAAGMLLVVSAMLAGPAGASSGGTRSHHHHHHRHHSHRHHHHRKRSPFAGNGMWIWYVSRSENGDLHRIARRARRHRIRTLYVKAADGDTAWSQFTPHLISFMHRHGLRVCAWQYTYGNAPRREARTAAAVTKHTGADCFVIDAESEYEGHYARADEYMGVLRARLGNHFPIGLAGFPYVDYHPGYPYSVFLGPGGARYNLPQLYWHTIGTTVGDGFLHTFTYNRVYGHRLMPLGQTYASPPVHQIEKFRRYAHSYGFDGLSWWDWQETKRRAWSRLGGRPGHIRGFKKPRAFPTLRRGSAGDLVVWAQEHLRGAGRGLKVNGRYRDRMVRAVRHFQAHEGLKVDGVVGRATWRHLLSYRPDPVNWSRRGRRGKVGASEPWSARLPAVRDEIPPPSERGP